MKQKQFLILSISLIISLVTILPGCKKSQDNDDQTAGWMLLALANTGSNRTTAQQASAATSASSAATSSVSSGAGAPTWTFFPQQKKDLMLAAMDRAYRAKTGKAMPQVLVTAFACQDGTCNKGAAEVLTGTAACSGGGTITANNVGMTLTGTANTTNFNVSISYNGPFSFNNCITSGYDYSVLPNLAFASYTLNGALNLNGTSASQATVSGSTTTSTATNNMTYTSSTLTVNGSSPISMSIADTTTGTAVVTSSGSTFTAVMNLTVRLNGTLNGQTVSLNSPLNVTVTCVLSGGNFTCQ